jgi:hypothetical protein
VIQRVAGRRRGRRRRQNLGFWVRIRRHPSVPPLVSAVWAAALAAAADSGRYAFAATVLVLQLAVAHGWLRLLRGADDPARDENRDGTEALVHARLVPLAQGPTPVAGRGAERGLVGRGAEPGWVVRGAEPGWVVRGAEREFVGRGAEPSAVPVEGPAKVGSAISSGGGIGAFVLVSALAVAADAVLLVGQEDSPGLLAVVLGLGVSAGFFQQVARPRAGSPGLSLVPCVSGAALVMLAATWLVVDSALGHGRMLAILGAIGAAALGSALLIGISHVISGPILVSVAAAVGWAIGSLEPLPGVGHVAHGVALGVTAGLVYVATRVAGGYARARAMEQVAFAAAIPLVAVAPVAYLVGAILAG